ncbi:serine/threonine protein kinase [Haloactinospora alba]|uniref:non-specific serine/threonine protein kinase n=1 Tax=Haloactinospora alba TaxID=405555 RepID=A0A543NFR8_9ACTN|nr:serine/threonine-protein kinase [Haloactinospora alba]TQN30665.1 serine/threonine protein kinase [Haloactinospora alba]
MAEEHTGGRVVAGRYELREELGRGGMGVVWLAHDHSLARDVAIKEVLVPDHVTGEERTEAHSRIRREAQTAARIAHPAVITVHDILDVDGHPWIVMERIEGESLQERLDSRGPLPEAAARTMAEAIVGALHAAHELGVVHRDVKPANIMLAGDGRAMLTDFGIATVDGATALTRTGTLIGSPEYMAPERLEREEALAASDLWSLGATLHAAVEGRSPFHRETLTGTITAVVTLPVPPPEHAGGLTPLITGLLNRDIERRPTAEQARDLLSGTEGTHRLSPSNPTRVLPDATGPPAPDTPPRREGGVVSSDHPLRATPHTPSAPPQRPSSRPVPEPSPPSPPSRALDASGTGEEDPPVPPSIHAARALLMMFGAQALILGVINLGEDTLWYLVRIPVAVVWLVEGAVALAVGFRLSFGRGGVLAAAVVFSVLRILVILSDMFHGYDPRIWMLVLFPAVVFLVAREDARDFLLHRRG